MELTRISYVYETLNIKFNCPIFIVGGTNGKGSTCALLESILYASGYNVGCYTSPHLLYFNERVRINKVAVEDNSLIKQFNFIKKTLKKLAKPTTLTYFEFITLAVMNLFQFSKLDVIIMEVGLGGRLDAVNILNAHCAIVTSVSIDHTNYLGNTRELIGLEKAGIFRKDCPAIIGDQNPPNSLLKYARKISANLWIHGKDFNISVDSKVNFSSFNKNYIYNGRYKKIKNINFSKLQGNHQLLNIANVLASLEAMSHSLPVNINEINKGLNTVKIPGRCQVLPGKPLIILDVAHNQESTEILSQHLCLINNYEIFNYTTYAIFGVMKDKDIKSIILSIKNQINQWYICHLSVNRSACPLEIEKCIKSVTNKTNNTYIYSNVQLAYRDLIKRANKNDRIVVFGSFYTVAEVLKEYKKNS